MINLTQIQSLEQKVIRAVGLIKRLREENQTLRSRLQSTEPKIQELEAIVNTYKKDQSAIENSILNVLSKLDKLEDDVSAAGQSPSSKESTASESHGNEVTPSGGSGRSEAVRGDKNKPVTGEKDLSHPSAEPNTELDIF
jgi:chromosome segregation ATPase